MSNGIDRSFKFVGQHGVMTEPNGFYYMKARYYDPNVGRFISEDPIGFEGGDVNLMVYVGNNPILEIDPDGLKVSVVWRPLKGGAWIAGYHQAIKINDKIYGFGPNGVIEEDLRDYRWGSHEKVVYPDDKYDKAFLEYVKNAAAGNDRRYTKDTYGLRPGKNSCMNFVDTSLQEAPNYSTGSPK